MNDKNKALIFDESNDVIITITDEDGNEADVYIIAAMEIEELGKEFVAALPVKGTKDFPEDEALILEYSEDADGDPVFSPIEDDETMEMASEAFDQFISELSDDDDGDDGDDDNYLSDLGDYLPGVSVKKDK